jgi:YCII-related domain
MASYLFSFRGPRNSVLVPETFEAWAHWQRRLGPRLKDRGYPTLSAETVGASAEATTLGGYSVVRATSLAEAVELARGCPHLQDGGAVEVAELVNNDDPFDQWLAAQDRL